jgi:hypothetical protein
LKKKREEVESRVEAKAEEGLETAIRKRFGNIMHL